MRFKAACKCDPRNSELMIRIINDASTTSLEWIDHYLPLEDHEGKNRVTQAIVGKFHQAELNTLLPRLIAAKDAITITTLLLGNRQLLSILYESEANLSFMIEDPRFCRALRTMFDITHIAKLKNDDSFLAFLTQYTRLNATNVPKLTNALMASSQVDRILELYRLTKGEHMLACMAHNLGQHNRLFACLLSEHDYFKQLIKHGVLRNLSDELTHLVVSNFVLNHSNEFPTLLLQLDDARGLDEHQHEHILAFCLNRNNTLITTHIQKVDVQAFVNLIKQADSRDSKAACINAISACFAEDIPRMCRILRAAEEPLSYIIEETFSRIINGSIDDAIFIEQLNTRLPHVEGYQPSVVLLEQFLLQAQQRQHWEAFNFCLMRFHQAILARFKQNPALIIDFIVAPETTYTLLPFVDLTKLAFDPEQMLQMICRLCVTPSDDQHALATLLQQHDNFDVITLNESFNNLSPLVDENPRALTLFLCHMKIEHLIDDVDGLQNINENGNMAERIINTLRIAYRMVQQNVPDNSATVLTYDPVIITLAQHIARRRADYDRELLDDVFGVLLEMHDFNPRQTPTVPQVANLHIQELRYTLSEQLQVLRGHGQGREARRYDQWRRRHKRDTLIKIEQLGQQEGQEQRAGRIAVAATTPGSFFNRHRHPRKDGLTASQKKLQRLQSNLNKRRGR